MYFSGSGSTYDDLYINGYRTRSITQGDGAHGYDRYDLSIPVQGHHKIQWGYLLRAVDARCVKLAAEFYDRNGACVETKEIDITERISCNFSWQTVLFKIPCRACSVQLSLHFYGKTTACTYYAPAACYC